MRILSIVHVYYPEFWPELATCLKNVDGPMDLVVTYVDASRGIPEMVLRDFPQARFVKCENRGFDIWPFIKAYNAMCHSADDYDLLVKLHTKRDLGKGNVLVGGAWFSGSEWRESLLGFIRRKEDWDATALRFRDPSVGMVADAGVICCRADILGKFVKGTFDRAVRFVGRLYGTPACTRGWCFVAGSMFAARPAALHRLLTCGWRPFYFVSTVRDGHEHIAHYLERALGFAVYAAGMRIVPCHGSEWECLLNRVVRRICQFFKWYVLAIERPNGRLIVKLFRLSVYRGPAKP